MDVVEGLEVISVVGGGRRRKEEEGGGRTRRGRGATTKVGREVVPHHPCIIQEI